MTTEQGKKKAISLKELYKLVYGKVFCIDNIENLQNEEWKEIEETEARYFISNKGRVKSYCKYEAIILQPNITSKGYERLQIIQNGIVINKFVHCLVASAFKEECGTPQSNDWQVHHKDYNKRNNASDNLQWVSKAEHIKIHNSIIQEQEKGE